MVQVSKCEKRKGRTRLALVSLFAILVIHAWTLTSKAYADSLNSYLTRCAPYREIIETILEEESVPKEYFALLLAESGCDLRNVSSKGAKGPWQLTNMIAKTYGVSDPFNLEQATKGAAKYLRSLINRFGDMRWVVAAYNAGGSNLKRVTGHPNAKFSVVKSVRPESYYLSLKVIRFVDRIKEIDEQGTINGKDRENKDSHSNDECTQAVTEREGMDRTDSGENAGSGNRT